MVVPNWDLWTLEGGVRLAGSFWLAPAPRKVRHAYVVAAELQSRKKGLQRLILKALPRRLRTGSTVGLAVTGIAGKTGSALAAAALYPAPNRLPTALRSRVSAA